MANLLLRALHQPDNLGRDQGGPGGHRYLPLPGHDNDMSIRQRFGHGFFGLLEGTRALAPAPMAPVGCSSAQVINSGRVLREDRTLSVTKVSAAGLGRSRRWGRCPEE